MVSAQVDELNLAHIGPHFENNPVFPARTNTEFVEVRIPLRYSSISGCPAITLAFFTVLLNQMRCVLLQMLSRSHVRMHVWERGAGATLACGTGACATVVAGVLEGRLDRKCR